MYVHMYYMQETQCPYIVSNAAMIKSGNRPVSLINTLNYLCAILVFMCITNYLYLYQIYIGIFKKASRIITVLKIIK